MQRVLYCLIAFFSPLQTEDHKPSHRGERQRVMDAGGIIGLDPATAPMDLTDGCQRVYTASGKGGLAVCVVCLFALVLHSNR